jgi:hypothetical protein
MCVYFEGDKNNKCFNSRSYITRMAHAHAHQFAPPMPPEKCAKKTVRLSGCRILKWGETKAMPI